MIHHIRPWQLFAHLPPGEHDVLYRIPSHRGWGESETIMSLETLLLIAAARITRVHSILELGTCLGYNSYQLARNLPVARIATVDRTPKLHVFDGTPESLRITPLVADIFDNNFGKFDLVFCDINYTERTLARSTEIAFAADPKIIAWHDYRHPLLPHTEGFHHHLAESCELYHVEDSWMVFWFREGLGGGLA